MKNWIQNLTLKLMSNLMTNYYFLQKIVSSLVPEWTPTGGMEPIPALNKVLSYYFGYH